jgi:hypothetical protein
MVGMKMKAKQKAMSHIMAKSWKGKGSEYPLRFTNSRIMKGVTKRQATTTGASRCLAEPRRRENSAIRGVPKSMRDAATRPIPMMISTTEGGNGCSFRMRL